MREYIIFFLLFNVKAIIKIYCISTIIASVLFPLFRALFCNIYDAMVYLLQYTIHNCLKTIIAHFGCCCRWLENGYVWNI